MQAQFSKKNRKTAVLGVQKYSMTVKGVFLAKLKKKL